MWVISNFFFPDESTKLLVALCYIILLFTAFKRFEKLAIDYETFDAPENSRPWTSLFRFYSAFVIYFCFYVFLFALFYRFFLKYPELVKLAQDIFKADPLAQKIIPKITDAPQYLYPILSIFFLTIGVNKIKPVNSFERDVRKFFQRIGSIPKKISFTTRLMRSAILRFDEDVCMQTMAEELTTELKSQLTQSDERSFERIYIITKYLFMKIDGWNEKSSPYYHFRTVYQKQYENIRSAFLRIENDTQRYFSAMFEIRRTYNSLKQIDKSALGSINPEDLFIPLRKSRVELREGLKGIMNNMHTFIACAIHSEGFSEKDRIKQIQKLGFHISPKYLQSVSFADPNDLALLTFFLSFVIPVVTLFCNSFSGTTIKSNSLSIFVVWPAMAIWVGLSSIGPVALIKKQIETSQEGIWGWLQKSTAKFNILAYMIAGVIAFVTSLIGLVCLGYLNPAYRKTLLCDAIQELGPWALLAFAISIATGFNFDRDSSGKKTMIFYDVITTAIASIIAASAAIFLSEGQFEISFLFNDTNLLFILPAAALVGGLVGGIFPQRYRLHKALNIKLEYEEIDLAILIGKQLHTMVDWIQKKRVKVESNLDPNILIDADRLWIGKVLCGLFSNAFEHTAPDNIITINANQLDNEYAQIQISHNGIGINQTQLFEIKESFKNSKHVPMIYSFDSETPTDLKQINYIVVLHGGALDISINESGGTDVKITLPIKK